MIDLEDVISVANSINIQLDDDSIQWVLNNFESYAKDEQYSSWDLIVERMLYEINTM